MFSSLSGETHLLSVLPAETLRLIAEGPIDFLPLCRVLAERCEADDSSAWRAKMGAIVRELAEHDLIEADAR